VLAPAGLQPRLYNEDERGNGKSTVERLSFLGHAAAEDLPASGNRLGCRIGATITDGSLPPRPVAPNFEMDIPVRLPEARAWQT
jgi:hypothetical protein